MRQMIQICEILDCFSVKDYCVEIFLGNKSARAISRNVSKTMLVPASASRPTLHKEQNTRKYPKSASIVIILTRVSYCVPSEIWDGANTL
jgi:hypothetical protein